MGQGGFGKLRYEISRDNEEKITDELGEEIEDQITSEEREKLDEIEAMSRQIFDPKTKVFNLQKQRVTDMEDNARVTLPKPLPPSDEANIEIRRNMYKKMEDDYKEKYCDSAGKQPSNLTKQQEIGLKRLRKRLREKEIIIMKTDKSNKFSVTSVEDYIKLGEEHTGKDKEITLAEITEREKILNGHCSMWIKMWGVAEAHNQSDRVRGSRITHSCNVASMTLLHKDHKKDLQVRPLVTGNTSNTRGMSIMVAQVLESVADSITTPFEVISTEDFLAKLQQLNYDISRLREKPCEEIYMIGADAVALFPSLMGVRTGKIVRVRTEESEIILEGTDYKEMARYVRNNMDKTGDLEDLRSILPWRRKVGGKEPGMRNKEVLGKEKGT